MEGAVAVAEADANVADAGWIELISVTGTDRHDQVWRAVAIDVGRLHRVEIAFTILIRARAEAKVHRQRCHKRSLEVYWVRLADAYWLADSIWAQESEGGIAGVGRHKADTRTKVASRHRNGIIASLKRLNFEWGGHDGISRRSTRKYRWPIR